MKYIMNVLLSVTVFFYFCPIPCATLPMQLPPHVQYASEYQYQRDHTLMYIRGIFIPPSSKHLNWSGY